MSKRIVLAKCARVPLHVQALRPVGFTAEVDEETYEVLLAKGVLAVEPPAAPEAESEPEVESEPEPVPEPKSSVNSRPARTATLGVWRDYAATLGVKTSGMTKAEIIGAIDAL